MHFAIDWILAAILIASPFLFGFSDESTPTAIFIAAGVTDDVSAFAARHAEAVGLARELAGDLEVAVAGGHTARSVLDAGELDVVDVCLVPVVLGAGRPWLAGARGPVRLSDPVVTTATGVTHLRYRVRR